MKKNLIFCSLIALLSTSCISTKLTIKNIDDKAPIPALSEDKTFILTKVSTDSKYGYDQDYPVNLGFMRFEIVDVNIKRYFGALTGPQGQEISYEKVDTCCPFPSKRNAMGAGLLDIYEVTWDGLKEPKRIYINLYEKGEIIAPMGFGIKDAE